MGGNDEIAAMDRDLPESTILLFRRLAHAKVGGGGGGGGCVAPGGERRQHLFYCHACTG